MNNKNSESMAVLQRVNIVITPKGAGHHVSKFLKRKGISANQAGATMGVSPSTVTRFTSGGSLTESMAAKLGKHYKLPIEMLFNLESSFHAHNAIGMLATA